MEILRFIYRFGHHDFSNNTDYQLFESILKELYITRGLTDPKSETESGFSGFRPIDLEREVMSNPN